MTEQAGTVRETETGKRPGGIAPATSRRSMQAVVSLLAVPLAVYGIWIGTVFFLDGVPAPYGDSDGTMVLAYTVLSCIAAGTLLPVAAIRRTFITGAVNMFQLGFRSRRRTVLMVLLSIIILYTAFLLAGPYGGDRPAFIMAFLLYLPTAVASVMVCWVLVGTHVQAFVRERGTAVAIVTGVLASSLVFGVSSAVHSPQLGGGAGVAAFILLGIITSFFFYSVRDVYATAVLVAGSGSLMQAGCPATAAAACPAAAILSGAALACIGLIAVHLYFSRRFVTVPVGRQFAGPGPAR